MKRISFCSQWPNRRIVLALCLILPLAWPTASQADWVSDLQLRFSDASFWGETNDERLGKALAGVGDVNGDGYDDFLISAGQTYLILGRPAGWAVDTPIIASADASFIGEAAGDSSGGTVAGAGDVNGDGYDDFLIGAQNNDEAGNAAGQTYVILGRPAGWAMDMPLSSADASFLGEHAGDHSGQVACGAGDVNGDGFDDILIAAADYSGGVDAGMTYIIFGRDSGWSMDTPLSTADASLRGEAPGDRSGTALAWIGDANGDGYDDFLVGAPGRNASGMANAGKTYLILGRASGWRTNISLSFADASWLGEGSPDYAGKSLAGAGDVNGDGFDDFIIGSGSDEAHYNAGQTYLILGRAAGWGIDISLSAADASFLGEEAKDMAGSAVAGAGDVNGDGFADFLIGAPGNGEWSWNTGQAYLILGRASGWAMDTDLAQADASFWGERNGHTSIHHSTILAGVGDVDGNGFDDILIGAPGDYEAGDVAGQAYLLLSDYLNPDTVSCTMSCIPAAGTLPFDTLITLTLLNHYQGQFRRMAGQIDVRLANGRFFPSYRAGFANIGPGAMFTSSWTANMKVLGSLVGQHTFTLRARDVTPYPYNQPPHPPAGYTDSDACSVEGISP